MHTRLRVAYGVLVSALAIAPTASAQTTRAEEWAAEQAKKEAASRPYVASGPERWVSNVRKELLEQPSGLYPVFGSVYSGGGFTLGGGYRDYVADRTHWDITGLYSIKNYSFLQFSGDSWGHAEGRLDLHGRVGWRDATQVAYYGLGNDSPNARANFHMTQLFAGGDVRMRPVSPLVFGVGVTFDDYKLREGQGAAPSIEESFTPETAPALGVDPTYVHAEVSAGVDWRPSPGYARRGGLYELRYHSFLEDEGTYSFDRLDAEVVQHLPILRETWVVSLRGAVQTTLSDTDIVPYFLLPSLGSGSTLRAYPSWRFRDRHSLLMSGELRWIPNRLGVDMALFYDAGKVTPRWNDLSLKHLKSDVGIGIRFHSPLATPLRIELAKGSEGLQLVFAGSAAF